MVEQLPWHRQDSGFDLKHNNRVEKKIYFGQHNEFWWSLRLKYISLTPFTICKVGK